MSAIRMYPLPNTSVLRMYAERENIQTDPPYQRMGEVWTKEKKQLFIDSILNEFDIPKMYFHEFTKPKTLSSGKKVKYAIIDGRQRLETIWDFINGKFDLGCDFLYFDDPAIKLQSCTYKDIAKMYPNFKNIIDSYTLPIVSVITDDIDMIEEMFSRLNEAVPLNAAEKRNALGGVMPTIIRRVANHNFFKEKVSLSNKRYQHREVSCRFLWLVYNGSKTVDTKKAYLDNFVREFKKGKLQKEAKNLEEHVANILARVATVFLKNDRLLKKQAMLTIYFMVFKKAIEEEWIHIVKRKYLLDFEETRKKNTKSATENIAEADYELLQFDRMTVQGTNDGVSIKFRTNVLYKFLKRKCNIE